MTRTGDGYREDDGRDALQRSQGQRARSSAHRDGTGANNQTSRRTAGSNSNASANASANYDEVIERYRSSRHARVQPQARSTTNLESTESYRRARTRREEGERAERLRASEASVREQQARELERARAQARKDAERDARRAQRAAVRDDMREQGRRTRARAASAWQQAHDTAHFVDEQAERERMERAARRRQARDERIERNRTSRKRSYEYVDDTDRSGTRLLITSVLAVVVVLLAVVVFLRPFGLTLLPGGGGEKDAQSAAQEEQAAQVTPPATPIMAESSGVQLHLAVPMDKLTEVLIHNASYAYAQEITTELTEATNVDVIAAHGTGRDLSAQPTGDAWMTGEFIRCYREGNAGPKMSAIDCGAAVGTTVLAPVSGTVVLVKDYKLYEQYDDVQVHIQPEGRADLDVVLIHLTDPQVSAGDTVVAGVTPLASVRDVYAYIGEEMQLKDYTAKEDNGNHTHIAVNDATDKDYHGLDDLKPKKTSESKKAN